MLDKGIKASVRPFGQKSEQEFSTTESLARRMSCLSAAGGYTVLMSPIGSKRNDWSGRR